MTSQCREFFVSGTFVVPVGVSCIQVTMIGGGAGSGSAVPGIGEFPHGSGAGGAGELVQKFSMTVVPQSSIAITIGAGGSAGITADTPGGNGGTSTCGTFLRCVGGWGGSPWNTNTQHSGAGAGAGGNGGGVYGGLGGTSSGPAPPVLGNSETPTHFGGAGGGRGNTTPTENRGAGEVGITRPLGGGGNQGGGGGASSPWGKAPDGSANSNGTTPGSTVYGGGASAPGPYGQGAAGQKGYCMIMWMG